MAGVYILMPDGIAKSNDPGYCEGTKDLRILGLKDIPFFIY